MTNSRLQADLKRLDGLAYHRREWGEAAITRYHEVRRKLGEAALEPLARIYAWMFVPVTLWPFQVQDVFETCLDTLAAGKPLDRDMLLLLELLPEPPTENVCAVVAGHEHDVQAGRYEPLVRAPVKFDSMERSLAREPEFRREWEQLKAAWDAASFRDHKGIIRRTLTAERNLQPSFAVIWSEKSHRFQAVFDAFCFRWNLYGMQDDEPLLMKLSVNLTPHGTMIFIPAYWSFDPKRDVRWGEVGRLHRARAAKRQGQKIFEGIEQRRRDAEKLHELDAQAKELKLKGERRHGFLCDGLGWDRRTESKRLANLRKEFPQAEP